MNFAKVAPLNAPPLLTGYSRLTIRYERKAHLFGAFLSLAAALTCFKKLAI